MPKWLPRLPQLRVMSAQDASTAQGRAKRFLLIGDWREDLKQKWLEATDPFPFIKPLEDQRRVVLGFLLGGGGEPITTTTFFHGTSPARPARVIFRPGLDPHTNISLAEHQGRLFRRR